MSQSPTTRLIELLEPMSRQERKAKIDALKDQYAPLSLTELIALSNMEHNYLSRVWQTHMAGFNGELGEH